MNAVEIEEAVSLLAEAPFDAAEFPFQFLEAFGNKATTIKRLRKGTSTNKSDVDGGVLQRGHIHMATCAPGQVAEMMQTLRDSPATQNKRYKVTYILATDGVEFQAENLVDAEQVACKYAHFSDHFGFFLALAGITTVKEIRENAFDIKATGRLNKLYLELLKHNPDWAKDERREDLNHFLARLIFCFFAEDTNIFVDNLFTARVEQMSDRDASNTHEVLAELFRAMATDRKERDAAGTAKWAKAFPYVNGGLFSGETETPRFSKIARTYLLGIGRLDWKQVNPDIFGSMIQAVAGDEDRSALGMHYTSVPNILKVLNPLFLDELREQLEAAGDNSRKLLNLRKRLAHIRVFDPACGSGNFLVIAYKQMREIEAEINKRRGEPDRFTSIPITNFRGIEIRHFAAEVARLALVIAKFQADVQHRGENLALSEFLPLQTENWIVCANALRIDWETVCPPLGKTQGKYNADDLFDTPLEQPQIGFENEGGEVFICGNPPYLGKGKLTSENKKDMAFLFSGRTHNWGYIDLVGAWVLKASDFVREHAATASLVTTNSIVMGRQVADLWPTVLSGDVIISYAHTSFQWSNNASHNAAVFVVIVGLSQKSGLGAVIFDGESSRLVDTISHYLTPGVTPLVKSVGNPISSNLAEVQLGNKPNDGKALRISFQEKKDFLSKDYRSSDFIRPFFGSNEYNNGLTKYCLWISDENVESAQSVILINERIEECFRVRSNFEDAANRKLAESPHQMREFNEATIHSIIIPVSTSERRSYITCGLLNRTAIVSSQAFVSYDAEIWNLSILLSSIHLAWVATICGKFKLDYRYSNDLGWNTFPVPKLTTEDKAALTRCAENILLARERYYPATIAHMYDPNRMDEEFPEVRRAHDANDETLERIYIGRRFKNDTERLEVLFKMYEKMVGAKKK